MSVAKSGYSFKGTLKLDLNFSELVPDLLQFYTSHRPLGQHGQVSLKKRPGGLDWIDGTGSLYDYSTRQFLDEESQFTEKVGQLPQMLVNLIDSVEAWLMDHWDLRVGRVRFINLARKTCLSYHCDPEPVRFHIPLQTNENCFFVVENLIYRMPELGVGYLLETNVPHTAVNSHFSSDRLHLVFSTFQKLK